MGGYPAAHFVIFLRLDKRTLQRIRVPAGFIFAALFFVFARPTVASLLIGSGIAIIGLGIRAWAAGHIRKAEQLAVSGPYAYTRNPLYIGSLLMAVGFTVAGGVWWLVLLVVVLFIGIYLPVIRVERDDMRRIFGAAYDDYAADVPLIVPRLTPWRRSDNKFDIGLYFKYREYRASIGVAIAIGALAAKAYFLK